MCPACLPHPVLPQAPLGSLGKGTDRSSSLPAQPARSRQLLSCLLLIHSHKHSNQYPAGMNEYADPLDHPMLQGCARQTAEFWGGDYKHAGKTQLPIVFIRLFLLKTINVFAISKRDAVWPMQRTLGWKWPNIAFVFTPALECLEILGNCLPFPCSSFAKCFVICTWAEHDYTKPVPFLKMTAFLATGELFLFNYLW